MDTKDIQFYKNRRLSVRPSDTEIRVVSEIDAFRRAAKTLPTSEDTVLEIGCSTGTTTQILTKTGAQVVAVDKSAELIQKLRQDFPHFASFVAQVDARNIPALVELIPNPTLIFIDIGGNVHLDNVALQLRLCLQAFQPRLIVVRSFELAILVSMVSEVEPPKLSGLSNRVPGEDVLSNLLLLSRSTNMHSRLFAVRNLSKHDTESARRRLQELASDPHHKIRKTARRACQALAISLSDEEKTPMADVFD